MKISDTTFVGNEGLVAHPPGIYGVRWITRGRRFATLPGLDDMHADFLDIVDGMTEALPDGDRYLYGTTYRRVLDATEPVPAGRWHYDTGLTYPTAVRNAGMPVLRFTAALSTGAASVANLFTRDPYVQGIPCDAPGAMPDDVVQPDNGRVVMFSEGVDLHARAARPAGTGRIEFFSATLYTPMQTPDLSCLALVSLR